MEAAIRLSAWPRRPVRVGLCYPFLARQSSVVSIDLLLVATPNDRTYPRAGRPAFLLRSRYVGRESRCSGRGALFSGADDPRPWPRRADRHPGIVRIAGDRLRCLAISSLSRLEECVLGRH